VTRPSLAKVAILSGAALIRLDPDVVRAAIDALALSMKLPDAGSARRNSETTAMNWAICAGSGFVSEHSPARPASFEIAAWVEM